MLNRKSLVVLALLLTGLVVNGFCGGKTDTAAAAGGPVNLKFFSNEAVMQDVFNRINAEYTRRNPNVNIEVVQIPMADYNLKVDTTVLSGEVLDVAYFNVMYQYAERAKQGEFYPLDDLLAKEGIKLLDVYSIDAKIEDGKVYGLPGDVKYMVVWLNKNDLDKAGLPVPPMDWTWDDYREYARKLTWGEGPNKHYGSYFHNWDHYNVLEAYNMIDDNPYLKKDGTLNLDNPYFRSSMELRHTLEQVDKTQLPVSEITAMQLDYRSVFFGGRASMLLMLTNIIPQAAQLKDFPHDFVTTFAPVPRARNNGRPGYTYADNRFYSIGATSSNPEETYKYLRFFTTEGIPMKNVTFTAEKKPAFSMEQMVDNLVAGGPHLYDVAQLKKLLTWPDMHPNIWSNVPSYTGEMVALYWAEADKAAMGELSIDDVFKNVRPQLEAIIARNRQ